MVARVFVIPSLLVTASFAQEVRYQYDRSVNFSKYKTYKWVNVRDSDDLGPLADQQVKRSIESSLAKKGMAKVEGEAELLVAYQTAINHEKQFSSDTDRVGSDWAYSPGWGKSAFDRSTTGQTTTVHIGAIGLDLYDAGKQQLIWRGEVSKALNPQTKPDERNKNLEKALTKLLKDYPPHVKHKMNPNDQTAQ